MNVTITGAGTVKTNLRQLERETVMKSWHWGTIIIVLIIGYLVGVKFPSTGASLLSKVGM